MYTFVFKNGGWWLLCNDEETLRDFHEATDHIIFGDAIRFRNDDKDQYHSTYRASAPLDRAVEILAEDNMSSYDDAMGMLYGELLSRQQEAIVENGAIYINKAGGYHRKSTTSESCPIYRSEKLLWPHLKKTDIKITKFPGGQHYYARCGNVEVKDKDGNKWNTYDEAYEKAMELLN